MDSDVEIDRLYALPLGEFVAARNALAKELRSAGDRATADRVKALAKPNVAAWAVNRLWHDERDAFEELFDAAEEVREAMGSGGGGKGAAAKRGQAAKALLARAKKHLAANGHPVTPAVLQNVSHTFDAVVALGADRLDPPLGRLTRDLEPPGFDFLAGFQLPPAPKRVAKRGRAAKKPARAAPKSKPAKAAPAKAKTKAKAKAKAKKDDRQAKALEAARRALQQSEAALAAAEKEAQRLGRELSTAQKRATESARATKRAEEETRRAAQAEVEAKTAEKEAARAARAARTAARRAVAQVKTTRQRLAKLARAGR